MRCCLNAIIEAKCCTPGWGYKRAEKFAKKRLAELGVRGERAS